MEGLARLLIYEVITQSFILLSMSCFLLITNFSNIKASVSKVSMRNRSHYPLYPRTLSPAMQPPSSPLVHEPRVPNSKQKSIPSIAPRVPYLTAMLAQNARSNISDKKVPPAYDTAPTNEK